MEDTASFNVTSGIARIGYNTTTTGHGGGLYSKAGTTVSVNCSGSNGLYMGNNVAGGNGGGAFVAGTMTLGSGTHYIGAYTYSGTSVAGNQAAHGGGILVNGGTLEITGTAQINSNTATTGNGGGVYIAASSTLTSSGTLQVNSNTATAGNGGGIFATTAKTFSITGTGNTINSNTANSQGGGLYSTKTTVSISNCEISSNVAKTGHGGAMIIQGDSENVSTYTATLTGCDIIGNRCDNTDNTNSGDDDRGGAIFAQYLALTVSGGSIKNNITEYGRGGGIYFNTSGKTLTINGGCEISGNQAQLNGSTATTRGLGGGICMNAGTLVP
jgi:predicted outer membrane repeat protein